MFENKYYDIWWKEKEQRMKYSRSVTLGDWKRAGTAFADYEGRKRKPNRTTLIDLIGDRPPYVFVPPPGWMHVSEETYQLMQLCLSPHSHALLTAYWLQRFNSKKLPKK